MHCLTPLSRSSAAGFALVAMLLSSVAVAKEGSLSHRLAELHRAWTSNDAQREVAPQPAKGDLFEALGSAMPTPKMASRQMATAEPIPSPVQRRAGSALSSPGDRFDIGAALGGPAPIANSVEPTLAPPLAARTDESKEQALQPIEVAAKPSPGRRISESDIALDLISSTASSRDTSGVAPEASARLESATSLFASDPVVGEEHTDDSAAPAESGFATAEDAAAAAELRLDSLPKSDQIEAAELNANADNSAEDHWVDVPPMSEGKAAPSSPSAERAFGHQSEPAGAAMATATDSDVWISTPSTQPGGFVPQGSEDVLMSEQLPQLVSRVTGPKSILIGREAKFQVTIENRGEAAANQLATEVVAPAWVDVIHAMATAGAVQRSSNQAGGTALGWNVSSLAAGDSQTLDLVVVPKTSQPLSLGVNWRHAPVAATTTVEVQEPKLAMQITGPDEVFFGRPQTYRLSISNPGTGAAENVVVQLIPPGGGQPASSYRVEQLAAGESQVVDIEITARDPGELTIKTIAAADGNLRSEASQSIFCRQAELNVDWRGPSRKYAGTEATYYFRVRNPGTASAEQVEFDVTLPVGFIFRGASDGHQVDRATGRVVWKIGTLRPGDDCYLELRGAVNQAGANEFRLSAANAGGDVHDSKTATTEVVALADLKLDVSDPKGPVPVGAEVDYEITVTNRGRSTAEDVNVVGLFSAGIEPIAALGGDASIGDGRVGFRSIDALAAGQKIKLKIRARAQTAGTHLFRAEVLCRDLEIKLAAEETTRFFQDESTAAADGAPLEAASRASRFE